MLRRLNLLYESINAITYPLASDSGVIVRIKSFHNFTYTTDNIRLLHSSIESSSTAGCHISDNTALYTLNGILL